LVFMNRILILVVIMVLVLISGCTKTEGPDQSLSYEDVEDYRNGGMGEHENQTQISSASIFITKPRDLCRDVNCTDGRRVCPDGYVAKCSNFCLQDKGVCSECEPSCSGHEKVLADSINPASGDAGGEEGDPVGVPDSEPVCDKTCRACESLDIETCECKTIPFCDGNCVCEEGEYPSSSDCPNCSDGNLCTGDAYNYSTGSCIHEDICPEEGLGNGVIISEIMYNPEQNEDYNEWIEIYNPTERSANLTGWRLCNKSILPGYLNRSGEVLYDGGFVLEPAVYALITDGGSGSEVYSNITVGGFVSFHVNAGSLCGRLRNSGDLVWLSDSNDEIVFEINYTEFEMCEEGFTLENKGVWDCSEFEGGTPGY
jgi:hypothetical protein